MMLDKYIPELQKVIIERLLRNSNVLCGFFKCDSLLCVHAPPLANFNNHFTDNSLFLPATAQGLSCLSASLNQRVSVFCLGFGTELQLDLVRALAQDR